MKNKTLTFSNNSIKDKRIFPNKKEKEKEKENLVEKNFNFIQTEQNTNNYLGSQKNNNMTISYKKIPLNTNSNENKYLYRKISDGKNFYFYFLKIFYLLI